MPADVLSGVLSFAGTSPCDVKLSGVDTQIANLTDGVDGVYKLWSCESGRPLYKREQPGDHEQQGALG